MVRVPAGPFTMGSPEGANHARPDEFPEHEVYVKDFYIDQYEVTVEQYRRFVYDENRAAPGPWGFIDQERDAKKPVVSITWQEASEYCRWVGKRLPTEAEWEKAARGPEKRTYPWGESAPDSHTANFGRVWEPEKIYSEKLTDVGTYERGKSPYGAYDMAGNVWEWVQDWYGATYYRTSPRENPPGPSSGEFKVLRGGSWNDDHIAMRSAVRNWDHPSEGEVDIGFRCVRDAPDAP
jgi:formylglycine-generating enzyme